MAHEKTFEGDGNFAAFNACTAWLKARGFSVGPLQNGALTGVMHGDVVIGKWRTLDAEEQRDLHGFIYAHAGDYRAGPVTVVIRANAPVAVLEAFHSEADDKAAQAAVEGSEASSSWWGL